MTEKKTPKRTAYVATETVYVDGAIYRAGETFVTDQPEGRTWKPVDPVEKAAIDASEDDPNRKTDVDYTKLNATELRATAAAMGLNVPSGASKEDLIALIKAQDDPTR